VKLLLRRRDTHAQSVYMGTDKQRYSFPFLVFTIVA